MKISVVIIPCSKSKVIHPASEAFALSLSRAEQRCVEKEWLERLHSLPLVVVAGGLYAGRGFAYGLRAAVAAGARLYIVSAGLGLVAADCRVPTYGITVSGGGEESIRPRVAGKFDISQWWKAVSCGPYATPMVQVFEQFDGLIIIGASRPYIKMIAGALAALSDAHIARLRILGAQADDLLPARLAGCLHHYDVEEVNSVIPGTRYDFAQRALLYFVKGLSQQASPSTPVPTPTVIEASEKKKKHFVFMLDSGAFTEWRKGLKIDIEKYAAFVHQNRRLFRGGIFNLDVIGSDRDSYENWLELKRLGVETIPVHHFGDDDAYLKKYLDNADYIGLGGMAKISTNARISAMDYLWQNFLLLGSMPRCRIHGLGVTDTPIVVRYPWYSVDSTRAIAAAAFGSILIPVFSKGALSFEDLTRISVSDQTREFSNFYQLPGRSRTVLCDLISECGFTVNRTLEGRVLRSKMEFRKKKDISWVDGLGISDGFGQAPNADSDNLSSDRNARLDFSLQMMKRYTDHWRQHGRIIRIYNVVGAPTIFDVFVSRSNSQVTRGLISFAKMSDGFVNRLENVPNGNTENRAAVSDQVRVAGSGTEGDFRTSQQGGIRRQPDGGIQRRRGNSPPTAWRP